MIANSSCSGTDKLLGQLDTLIGSFDKKRTKLRRQDQLLFVCQAVLTLCTTILTGLHVNGLDDAFKTAALLTSSTATFFILLTGRFAYRNRWIAYTETSSRLHALKSRVELINVLANAGQRPAITSEEVLTFHDQMQNVLDRVDEEWSKIVTTQTGPQTVGSKVGD